MRDHHAAPPAESPVPSHYAPPQPEPTPTPMVGDLVFTSAAERLLGDKFNTYTGPFLLEITVSAGGKRRTVRSPEFSREPPHVMVT